MRKYIYLHTRTHCFPHFLFKMSGPRLGYQGFKKQLVTLVNLCIHSAG